MEFPVNKPELFYQHRVKNGNSPFWIVNILLIPGRMEKKAEFAGIQNLIAYSAGMAGWSILMNTISVMLIYYYLPPDNSGLPVLIPNTAIFGIFTVFSLILASGRLIDAITDPLIAWFSDRLTSPWGRRIPFMVVSVLPSVIFCILLFHPRYHTETPMNYRWLFIMQSSVLHLAHHVHCPVQCPDA